MPLTKWDRIFEIFKLRSVAEGNNFQSKNMRGLLLLLSSATICKALIPSLSSVIPSIHPYISEGVAHMSSSFFVSAAEDAREVITAEVAREVFSVEVSLCTVNLTSKLQKLLTPLDWNVDICSSGEGRCRIGPGRGALRFIQQNRGTQARVD